MGFRAATIKLQRFSDFTRGSGRGIWAGDEGKVAEWKRGGTSQYMYMYIPSYK